MSAENDPLFAFFAEVSAVALLAETAFERVLPGELTMAQFAVLDHFVRSRVEKKGPAELARALKVTKATMTSTLQRLESKGLVAITPDPDDRRSKFVRPTPAGTAMRQACLDALTPELARFKPLLGAVYVPGMTRDLARVRAVLEQKPA
jgi:DNA-binding MarR family transcriptional regulator